MVDGKAVPLNGFIQQFMGNVITGMAESLRGVSPDWKSIEIKLDK